MSSQTPEPIKKIITMCWDANPSRRPSFEQVLFFFYICSVEQLLFNTNLQPLIPNSYPVTPKGVVQMSLNKCPKDNYEN